MLSNPLENTIVALIGFAGTGKYTIGREFCERTGARLIHNHLINNPIFTVVGADGVTRLPAGVWGRVKEIRATVYQAIRELSPPEMSFVITMELRKSNPSDHVAFHDLADLAAARQSRFVPIRLICGVEELCRRVVDPGRVAMLKEISPEQTRKKSFEDEVLNIPHPNLRTLDVTKRTASGSVDAILDEVNAIKSVSNLTFPAGVTVSRATNKEIVQDYVDAFNRGDLEALSDLFASDALVYGVLGWGGMDQVVPIWHEIKAAFDIKLHVEEIIAEGDIVAVRYVERGTSCGSFRGGPVTGKSFEVVAMEWFVIKDGKIQRRWGARDNASQMRQMGLPLS